MANYYPGKSINPKLFGFFKGDPTYPIPDTPSEMQLSGSFYGEVTASMG
jgi:hypothetical protein